MAKKTTQPPRRSNVARPPFRRVTTPRTAAPPTAPAQQQEARPPFLKAQNIGAGANLKLIPGTIRTIMGRFGAQVLVDVECHGAVYTWGIGVDKPNLRLLIGLLVERFDGEIPVSTRSGATGTAYIAIESESTDEEIPF